MATFQISHATASSQLSLNNKASTSYLHLSGHGPRTIKGKADQDGDQEMFEADEDGEMDEDLMGESENSNRLATAGQAIASSVTFMRGHGAYLSSASLSDGVAPLIRSSLCGVVRKTNKLISVNSLKTRFAPEVGDLVVGRITDLQPGNRRWRVDIRSRQEANLLLSSINLPGGIQRRKLESDELEMRNYFKEGDLLVCEVQSLFHDGSTSLHTRSLNYGKLRNGQLAIVNPCLIRRLKSHFVRMEDLGLEIIIGLNGVLWISMLDTGKVNIATGTGRDIEAIYSDSNDIVTSLIRRRIGRMLEIVAILSHNHRPISDLALRKGYEASVDLVPIEEEEDNEAKQSSNGLTGDVCNAILDHIDQSGD